MGRLTGFITSQVLQIRKGDGRILLRKIFHIFLLVPGVVIVLILRFISRWVHVRFGQLLSHRIGHYAANTEVYLCRRDTFPADRKFVDLFYNSEPVSNEQLHRMWKRVITINPFIRYLYRFTFLVPGGSEHRLQMGGFLDRDTGALMADTLPHLAFTPEETVSGSESLKNMGVSDGTPFICFHARDPVYLSRKYPQYDWSYHDYRNSEINSFLPGVEELVKRGYRALRMGSLVGQQLRTDNPGIIDYASDGSRSEFLDVFLSAHCRFFLSTGTGLDAIPMVFRRPIVYVNFAPVEYVASYVRDSLTIFKKYWLVGEQRFMTFREIIASGAGRFMDSADFARHGIELRENTPDEIRDVILEMDERLNGTWREGEEDEELQRRFWSLIPQSELNSVVKARIGAQYLRSNRHLFDQ